jgi:hypothetical protein
MENIREVFRQQLQDEFTVKNAEVLEDGTLTVTELLPKIWFTDHKKATIVGVWERKNGSVYSFGFTVIQFNSAGSDAITEPSQHSSITTNGSSATATKTTGPNHRSASSSTSGAAILVKATVH